MFCCNTQLSGRTGCTSSKKEPIWKWIPIVKKAPNHDMSSSFKQALLSNPNGNELEAQKSANEAMEDDVPKGLSDNSKTIAQPLDNAHGQLIYAGKFTSKVLNCGSFMEDDEEIDSSLHPFDGPLKSKWSFNSMRKIRDLNFPARI